MLSAALLALAAMPLTALAQNETVLGVYMFHRHGDRTAKQTPPANLTVLGFQEVYTSGEYFRNRYVADNAAYKIKGLNSDLVRTSQLAVSAPADTVLQNSATGFLQALYPPVGEGLATSTLRNGTQIQSPGNGYQLIPVALSTTGSGSEDNSWLQSTSGCNNAVISSNNYFSSAQYMGLYNSTMGFYNNLDPVVNGSFAASATNFKNAYTIFDLINVAEIHNATINGSDLLTSDVLFQLRTLADTHEWGLAYNASDDARAIQGAVLAGEIVQALNSTVTTKGKLPLNIQFGAYGTFSSFFGLADLPSVNSDFYGVSDYASVMVFEMFTNATNTSSYPSNDQIYVRFMFHNGTTSNISEPVTYPLFGTGQDILSWNDFTTGMGNFAISNTQQWCTACGNMTGTCAQYANSSSSSSSSGSSSTTTSSSYSGNGLSPAVNGVIGAMVTLAVILLIEGLILLLGGLRVVSKKSLAAAGAGSNTVKA